MYNLMVWLYNRLQNLTLSQINFYLSLQISAARSNFLKSFAFYSSKLGNQVVLQGGISQNQNSAL